MLRRSRVWMSTVWWFWRLFSEQTDPTVRIAGAMDNGEPFLVERRIGRGRVLMAAIALDAEDSNLPRCRCFVPLMHESICYLAEASADKANVEAGAPVLLELSAGGGGGESGSAYPA